MNAAVGVLIVDDASGLEPSFRAMLEHEPALRTIGETDINDDALSGAAQGPIAVVFAREDNIDNACARIASFREHHPLLRILVVFRALDASALGKLVETGADWFVGHTTSIRDICTTIVSIAQGETDAAAMPDGAKADGRDVPEGAGLTPREAEVLRFLSSGFSNKEVARRLSLSVRTVETHRLNLRRKTKTGRLKDLVQLARQIGLAPVLEGEARPLRRLALEARAAH